MITEVLTAAGLLLTVLLAYLQVQKNHIAALQLQEQHLRNQLRLQLYEKSTVVFFDASSRLSKAASQYRPVLNAITLYVEKGVGSGAMEPGMPFAEVVHDAHHHLTKVLLFLEEYEMVFARFRTIRRELSTANTKLLLTHAEFWGKLMIYLPSRDPKTGLLLGPVVLPGPPEREALERMHSSYESICNDLSGFFIALQIETQNELLGGLFSRQLPPRHPADPEVAVLGRDEDDNFVRPPGHIV